MLNTFYLKTLRFHCVFFFIDVDLYQPTAHHSILTIDPQVDLMFFQDVPGEAIARHALQRTGDFFGQGEPINECLGISGRDFESRWCCIGVGFSRLFWLFFKTLIWGNDPLGRICFFFKWVET